MQFSVLQQSHCAVELSTLLIGIATSSKTADNNRKLDSTVRGPALQAILLADVWQLLLSQARSFVIAFFSGEFNAFARKPAAASAAAAANTHTQPG